MAGWEALRDIGAFDFSKAIGEVQSLVLVPEGPGTQSQVQDLTTIFDLTLLGAASLTVGATEQEPETYPRRELEVSAQDCRISFLKFACALTLAHGPRSAANLQLLDILPFSGDAAKLGAVGVSSVTDLINNYDYYLTALIRLYQQSPSPLTKSVAENGWLHLESLVWQTTIYSITEPGSVRNVVDGYVAQYRQYLGYLGGQTGLAQT